MADDYTEREMRLIKERDAALTRAERAEATTSPPVQSVGEMRWLVERITGKGPHFGEVEHYDIKKLQQALWDQESGTVIWKDVPTVTKKG